MKFTVGELKAMLAGKEDDLIVILAEVSNGREHCIINSSLQFPAAPEVDPEGMLHRELGEPEVYLQLGIQPYFSW